MKKQSKKHTFNRMNGTRRKFDKEFKKEAVQLALSRGGPLREVAEGLGIRENLLGRWVREYRQDADHAFPGNGRLRPDDEELRILRKENAELKVENAILKKSRPFSPRGKNEVRLHRPACGLLRGRENVPGSQGISKRLLQL